MKDSNSLFSTDFKHLAHFTKEITQLKKLIVSHDDFIKDRLFYLRLAGPDVVVLVVKDLDYKVSLAVGGSMEVKEE